MASSPPHRRQRQQDHQSLRRLPLRLAEMDFPPPPWRRARRTTPTANSTPMTPRTTAPRSPSATATSPPSPSTTWTARWTKTNLAFASGGAAYSVYTDYDLAGRPTHAHFTSRTGTGVDYAYDTAGRETSETTFSKAMAYQWDLAGHRTRVTWPGRLLRGLPLRQRRAGQRGQRKRRDLGAGPLATPTATTTRPQAHAWPRQRGVHHLQLRHRRPSDRAQSERLEQRLQPELELRLQPREPAGGTGQLQRALRMDQPRHRPTTNHSNT